MVQESARSSHCVGADRGGNGGGGSECPPPLFLGCQKQIMISHRPGLQGKPRVGFGLPTLQDRGTLPTTESTHESTSGSWSPIPSLRHHAARRSRWFASLSTSSLARPGCGGYADSGSRSRRIGASLRSKRNSVPSISPQKAKPMPAVASTTLPAARMIPRSNTLHLRRNAQFCDCPRLPILKRLG